METPAQTKAIDNFINCQSLTNYQKMVNIGLEFKHIVNNKWVRLTEYKLPFENKHLIKLYNDDIQLIGLGIYNKN